MCGGVSWGRTCPLGRDPPGQTHSSLYVHWEEAGPFLELRLGVCDHDFQPRCPSWVPSEWEVSRDALDMTMERGLSSGGERDALDGGEQEGFYRLS